MLLIVVVVWKTWRWEGGLLAGYAFLVLAGTLLIREANGGDHLQLELFWSWRVWKAQKNQILTNIVMFVPVGILAGWMWKWRGLLVAVGLSAVIEILQLISSRGLCEIDDVIHNAFGALIGVSVIMLIRTIWKRWGLANGTQRIKS